MCYFKVIRGFFIIRDGVKGICRWFGERGRESRVCGIIFLNKVLEMIF